jgi:multisubunit Na+/H+ antiporter MnhF subunit
MSIDHMLLEAVTAFLLGGSVVSMYRVIAGPSAADRMIGMNMIAGQVLALLVIFAIQQESTLYFDVAMVYAVFGFIGLLVLIRVMGPKGDAS